MRSGAVAANSYTLYVASQNPHVERLLMTAFVLEYALLGIATALFAK